MAVMQMRRVSICALKKDRKAILERLQRMGVMEVNPILEEDDSFRHMDTASAIRSFEKAMMSAEGALEVLRVYEPEKKSPLAFLAGKERTEEAVYQKVVLGREELLKKAGQILALDKERTERKAEILKCENEAEALTPWLSLEIPTDYPGTAHTAVLLGTLPGKREAEEIYNAAALQEPELTGLDVSIISSGKDMTCVAVVCLKKEAAQVEEILRSIGFARPPQVWKKAPAQAAKDLEVQIHRCREQIEKTEQEIRSFAGSREDLKILADYYRMRAEKYEILGELPQSERTFFISGYVPEKQAARVEKAFSGRYDCVVDIDELSPEEEPPVLLKNNAFSASTEGVLAAFGLPKKGEIDPTTVMSFFYVFLFGLMLSDAAYGAIVSTACLVLLLKFPRMGEGMKKSLQLFLWCGLSTLFWGVMFGGYFGDLIQVVSRTFFGREIVIPALWFVPIDNPMKLLVYSLLFGVIHLFTGLAMKGYICLRDKQYLNFFCDVVLWFLFLGGLLILLLPSELFAAVAQAQIVFPPAVILAGKAAAIGGALGILLMSGRENPNFGVRIALGAYDLYNVTGWLSDVLSYSRLLALGLATGVIAQVVNQMGSMGGKSILGVILFIVVFLIGHTFNLAINLLGAYVHTNRLQYVEFFGKFYEGGGRAFKPFQANTKYADIKEEK